MRRIGSQDLHGRNPGVGHTTLMQTDEDKVRLAEDVLEVG